MTSSALTSIDELTDHRRLDQGRVVSLIQPETNGGRTTVDDLEVVGCNPGATVLKVSGLDQAAFEALIGKYGGRFAGIYLFKCPRITDLTPLEDLSALTHVAIYWNQRATRFWNFARTPALRGLQLHDFTKVRDLSDLASARSLDELDLGDAVWDKAVFESLEPLAALRQLVSLSLSAKRIVDGRIQPLAALERLTSLHFPSNMFTTRQVAWLRAHLPSSVGDTGLDPVWVFEGSELSNGKDVLLVGKRKPFLHPVDDAARIKRHVDQFWSMVEAFKRDPGAEPD